MRNRLSSKSGGPRRPMQNEILTISLIGLHSAEAATLRRLLSTIVRNVEIRARYREMRGRGLSASDAKGELADRYHLAIDTIHSVLWPS